jgi:putative transposase
MNKIEFTKGTKVIYMGQEFVISRGLDFKYVLATNVKTGLPEKLLIEKLAPFIESIPDKGNSDPEMRVWEALTKKEQEIAEKRFDIITPLLNEHRGNGSMVKEIAAKEKVHVATIYNWISKYESTGLMSSLADEQGRGGKGKSRLNPEVDEIIKNAIIDLYFKEDLNQEATCLQVIQLCKNAGLPLPAKNTIRNRIAALTDFERLKGKKGLRAAQQQHGATEGHLVANYPLEIVQIDHSLLNVKLVDEVYRRVLGRPWLTLAFDVFSRFPVGIYISLDTPGNTGTGLCLANAILPKEAYLVNLDVSGDWPCWGIMKTIHADNAKEFRGKMLKMACKEYGIKLIFRKVKTPEYGGHIERMMGTFKTDINHLPGKMVANKADRKYYDTDGTACMTLQEIERWLVTYIIKVYGNKFHEGIGNSPRKKLEEGIFGPNSNGSGIPPRITDESKVRLNFMPYEERTVQDYGIKWDRINYSADVLSTYINVVDPNSGKLHAKRKFIVRRDPRDISKIYFLDPKSKQYYTIPYRDITGPPMSIWEYREVVTKLRLQNKKEINEEDIFQGIREMRQIVEDAKVQTKKTRYKYAREQKMKREPKVTTPEQTAPTEFVPTANKTRREIKVFTDLSYESSD